MKFRPTDPKLIVQITEERGEYQSVVAAPGNRRVAIVPGIRRGRNLAVRAGTSVCEDQCIDGIAHTFARNGMRHRRAVSETETKPAGRRKKSVPP